MPRLEKIHNGGYVSPDDPGEIGTDKAPRGGVSDAEAGILAALVRGKRVLEIGTGLGVATRQMQQTALSLTTVDIDPWVAEAVAPELAALGVTTLSSLPQEEKYQFFFVDGDHTAEAVAKDYGWCVEHADSPAMIVIHDYTHIPHVRDSVPGLFIIDTEFGLGVGVI